MIYVITHKIFADETLDKDIYAILHVGLNSNCKSSYLRDDCGDNISYKKANYCEVTGLYCIWKNVEDPSETLTGINHYRRYFSTMPNYIRYTYFKGDPIILSQNKIEKALRKYDIIMPKKLKAFRKVKDIYAFEHCGEDISLLRKAIESVAPEFLGDYDRFMNSNSYWYANMMICKKIYFDEYCKWLFSVLDVLEPDIRLEKYPDAYQRRVFGFLAERLLNVWVIHKRLSVKEYPIINTEQRDETFIQQEVSRLKRIMK